MKKNVLGVIAATMLLAVPAMAQEKDVPQPTLQPAYNCDFQPSCEVAPGIYGRMGSPVQSKFNLSIGGFVKMDYTFQTKQVGPYFPGNTIPATGTAQDKDETILTARQSRFWLKVAGPTFLGAKTNALIEADFYGANSLSNEFGNLRMRLAYATLDWKHTQLLFGQFWDNFAPAAANTLDFRQGGPAGAPGNPRVPQIRLTQTFDLNADNYIKMVVAVQNPTQDQNSASGSTIPGSGSLTPLNLTNDQSLSTTGGYGSVPNGAVQLGLVSKALGVAPGFWGLPMNSLQVNFFGLAGSQRIVGEHAVDVYGYGVYGFVPLLASKDGKSRAMTASFETQGYISAGLTPQSANTVATTGPAGSRTAAKGWGALGQVVFYPIQDLGFTAGYGRRGIINSAVYANGTEKYQDLVWGNVAYDLNAAVRIAAEYEHGRSQFKGIPVASNGQPGATGDSGQINTVRLSLLYFF